MPNWVNNYIFLISYDKPEMLNQIHDMMRSEERPFDFEKLIPTPKEIDESDQWYDWRCANWNTKTNASCGKVIKGDFCILYQFSTAWAPPIPVICALSAAFPDFEFQYHYIDMSEYWLTHCCTMLGGHVLKESICQISESPEEEGYRYDAEKDDYVKIEDGMPVDDEDEEEGVFKNVFTLDDLTPEELENIDPDAPFDDEEDPVDLFDEEEEEE